MKNGCPGTDEGYDILVDGVPRTFRDREDTAIEAAAYLKRRHPAEVVDLHDRATGTKRVVLADGRLG